MKSLYFRIIWRMNTVLYTYPTVSLHKFDILFDKTINNKATFSHIFA